MNFHFISIYIFEIERDIGIEKSILIKIKLLHDENEDL